MSSAAADFMRAADPAEVFRQGVRDAKNRTTEPDPWQVEVMQSTAMRQLILCNRQAGKSTTVGARACSGLIYDPGIWLVIAPALRQSRELFKKITDVYRNLEGVPRIVRDNATEFELENGSRLIALPGNDDANIRGFSAPRAVIIDEASRVSDGVYTALRPMLAVSGGALIALTTPYGRRGWFFEAWMHQQGWTRTTITAHDCPRITPEFLAEEREKLGDWRFRQEMMCEFVDTDEAFFSSELAEAMMDSTLEAW